MKMKIGSLMKMLNDWDNYNERQRFYKSKDWQQLRTYIIYRDPLCKQCEKEGILKSSVDIDHIEDIIDKPHLRLEPSNLQGLCKECHSQKTYESIKDRIKQGRINNILKPVTKWKN